MYTPLRTRSFARCSKVDVVCNHCPFGIPPFSNCTVLVMPLKEPKHPFRDHFQRAHHFLLDEWVPVRLVSGTTTTPWAWHSVKCCTTCPTIPGGGKENPNGCPPVRGNLETTCANTSTPEDPEQSYREKNGSVWELPGMRCADAVDAMRLMLNGLRASHTLRKAPGCSRNVDSLEGREKASAMPFAVVGVHFNVHMNS